MTFVVQAENLGDFWVKFETLDEDDPEYEGDIEYEDETEVDFYEIDTQMINKESTDDIDYVDTDVLQDELQNQPKELRRSTREKKKTGSYVDYEPSFTGRKQKYEYSSAQIADDGGFGADELLAFVFGQFLLHQGLKKFGDKAEDGAFGEMKQMHEREAFVPRLVSELTPE